MHSCLPRLHSCERCYDRAWSIYTATQKVIDSDPISVQTWRQSNRLLGIKQRSFSEETVYWQPSLSGQRGGATGLFFTGGGSCRFRPNYSRQIHRSSARLWVRRVL